MQQPTVPGYVVLSRLGRGSSAEVWLAERSRDGLRVAVKVLARNGSDEPAEADDARLQALRETAVLGRTGGDHLVRLHEVLPLEDGGLALVLDLADGGSLARVVAGRGHLSAGEAVTVLAPVAGALADLHEAGVVHGDVSAGNVLFTREGRPMLADLGVARVAGEGPADVHGTLGFVAPEVVAGGAPSPASDVYSLGALGWLALTGAAPAPSALRPPLSTVRPDAPGELVAVLERCLSGPGQRPGAREVAVAVFDAAPAEPVRLATGSDPASELTHRLRAAAAAEPAAAPPPPPWWRRASGRVGLVGRLSPVGQRRRVAAAAGPAGAPGRRVTHAAGAAGMPRRRRGWPAAGTAVVAVALVGGPAAWAVSRHADAAAGRAAAADRPMPPKGAPPSARVATAAAGAETGGPVSDRKAPVTAPRGLLQQLADRRAAAWTARDPAALAAVDAPGSAALRSDVAQVATLLAQQATYRGLRHTVREATGTMAGTSATLRARVDTAAYRVVVGEGPPQPRPAVAGRPLTFTLGWTAQGWRIVSYR